MGLTGMVRTVFRVRQEGGPRLGHPFSRHQPAFDVITERLPATIQLAAFAFAISIIFSIPLGVISATQSNTPLDYLVTIVALIGQSVPSFWLGILLILLFGVT